MNDTLTEAQAELLSQMYPGEWMRPMDMGGRDGTNHSAVLAALVRKGRVERRSRGSDRSRRGSYVYRLVSDPDAVPRAATSEAKP